MLTAEEKREIGKVYFFHHEDDPDRRNTGLRFILEAHEEKDPEATYLVARFILDGIVRVFAKDQRDYALSLMCNSANAGCVQARGFLNAYCEDRYQERFESVSTDREQRTGLVDWEGKPIEIDRQGVFTPIDAVLDCRNGRNTLTLSANVQFLYDEEMNNAEEFERAVFRGLRAWQGEYEVFGGQKLSVRVKLTNESRVFDNLVIVPITDEIGAAIHSVSNAIGTKRGKVQITDVIENRRSFAANGLKWTVHSRKYICLQSENGLFDDYEELMHVSKHEFGHVLGLGDLYASPVDSLPGVEKGTYTELDCYAISDRYYNLVMCDHHGPISNNDIEMVLLAFRENKMQHYQPSRLKGKISSALGKGN